MFDRGVKRKVWVNNRISAATSSPNQTTNLLLHFNLSPWKGIKPSPQITNYTGLPQPRRKGYLESFLLVGKNYELYSVPG